MMGHGWRGVTRVVLAMLVLVGMVAVVQVGADGRESRAEAAPAALAQDPTSCPTPISLKNGNFESPTVPNGAGTNVLEGLQDWSG